MGNEMKYRVTLNREQGQWTGQSIDYPEAVDYAPTLRRLLAGMSDAIILAADLPDDADVEIELVPDDSLDRRLVQAMNLATRRSELAKAEEQLLENTATTAKSLSHDGFTMRDIAALTGISAGRAAQLIATK